jgi:hypothetical protein
MYESMAANVRQAAPYLDPRLVSPEALRDIQRVAQLLPLALGFQFECRLDTPLPRADLLPQFLPTYGSRQALLQLASSALPAAAREHPAWQGVARLCQGWSAPEDILHTKLGDVFLEFDLDVPPSEAPTPCVFADFEHEHERVTRAPTERALELLLAERFSPELRGCLLHCLEALPEFATVFAVGVMFPRGTREIRLCLSGGRRARLEDWFTYLARIGWSGNLESLESSLRELSGLTDRITLDIDVGEKVGPKVGFEFFIDARLDDSRPRWTRLLEQLVTQGHCLPEKREAALAWLGHANARGQRAEWPESLLRASQAASGQGLSMFLRKLSHLKLVHQPDRPVQAKVYMESLHRWLHFSQSQQAYVLDDAAPDAWVD